MMRHSKGVPLLDRGVRQAPWFGPDGELVLLAITSKHAKWKEVIVPHGASRVEAGEALEAELDLYDPPPPLLRVMRA
jgi:hypothetical protein